MVDNPNLWMRVLSDDETCPTEGEGRDVFYVLYTFNSHPQASRQYPLATQGERWGQLVTNDILRSSRRGVATESSKELEMRGQKSNI